MSNWKLLLLFIGVFLIFFFVPMDHPYVTGAILEAFNMMQEYAREHILLCLIPAFFIAGAIAQFISKGAVMKYLGTGAKKVVSYGVASVSGAILAVCSCTVLPLFSGIYKRGAGLGPAIAFLYSGPAINIMAIILTAQILGLELGLARAIGAIIFSIVIGLLMHFIYIKEERKKASEGGIVMPEDEHSPRKFWQNALYFISMVAILVFANIPKRQSIPIMQFLYNYKYHITVFFLLVLIFAIIKWFRKQEISSWIDATWDFAKQILPLLFIGVIIAGLLLGRPGQQGLIPGAWISTLVGGNSLFANFFASIVGAFMYFATLTEVPIIQGLLGSGMGKGPALALLLAGPALSLPNMLVIRSVLGTKKTMVFVGLVVVMSTFAGMIFGQIAS
jgi:hypothetical protein